MPPPEAEDGEDGEALLDANDGDPPPASGVVTATFAGSIEASDGGRSIGCGGGGGGREAAAFFHEDGVSPEFDEVDDGVEEVDFAAAALDDAASGLDSDVSALSLPRSPPRSAPRKSPRSIESGFVRVSHFPWSRV